MHASWVNLGDERNRKAFEKIFPTLFPSPPVIDRTKPVSEDILKGFIPLVDALTAAKTRAGLGDSISFADIIAMSYLRWLEISLQNEEQFKTLLQMEGGKCQALYDRFKEYLSVDKGEKYTLK